MWVMGEKNWKCVGFTLGHERVHLLLKNTVLIAPVPKSPAKPNELNRMSPHIGNRSFIDQKWNACATHAPLEFSPIDHQIVVSLDHPFAMLPFHVLNHRDSFRKIR